MLGKNILLRLGIAACCVGCIPACAQSSQAFSAKPRVRAVTAFVHLERPGYEAQLRAVAQKLGRAKAAYERAGYEVQTLRIATQPFPEYIAGLSDDEALDFLRRLEALAKEEDFLPALGPAMLKDADDPRYAALLARALRHTELLHGTVVVAGDDGVHWNAVRVAARVIKDLAENSPGGYGNFNFAAIAMLAPHAPFFPGAYNQGAGDEFAVAWEPANVIAEALENTHGDTTLAASRLEAALKPHAQKIEQVAQKLAGDLGWQYLGLDLSTAPLAEISIGGAMENFLDAPFGSSGTLTIAATITRTLRGLPVKQAGYSGMMIPVMEDAVLARRWSEGRLTVDQMLAYSAVCGTGLDTIPLPGEVTEEQLARIIGDMATLAFKLHKPLTARLMPFQGKKAGERTEISDSYLVNTVIQPLP